MKTRRGCDRLPNWWQANRWLLRAWWSIRRRYSGPPPVRGAAARKGRRRWQQFRTAADAALLQLLSVHHPGSEDSGPAHAYSAKSAMAATAWKWCIPVFKRRRRSPAAIKSENRDEGDKDFSASPDAHLPGCRRRAAGGSAHTGGQGHLRVADWQRDLLPRDVIAAANLPAGARPDHPCICPPTANRRWRWKAAAIRRGDGSNSTSYWRSRWRDAKALLAKEHAAPVIATGLLSTLLRQRLPFRLTAPRKRRWRRFA